MTGALEKAVRPFQLPAVEPRRVPTEQVAVAGPLILKFGMGNSMKTANGSFSSTTTYYSQAAQVEQWKAADTGG